MIKNLGNMVSRVLSSDNKSLDSVVFQAKRPPLDSEWNLVQDIQSEKLAEVLRSAIPSGFLNIEDIRTAPEDRTQINSSWKNAIVFNNPVAVVNGWLLKIGGGTDQRQEGAQYSVWHDLSNKENEVAFIGEEAPYLGSNDDLVFLEVWRSVLGTSDTVYKYGFVQSDLPNFSNELIDPNIQIETSKRVQIQYRLRWVKGVDFGSYRDGLGFLGCYAQGGLTSPNTSYHFIKSPADSGLYVAGAGTSTDAQALNTIDGFVYAIPMARIHRRNKQPYTLTNQNGAVYSITSGSVSDRPDKLFYDEISARDVEDLRHKVSLTGYNFQELLEENLHLLWSNSLNGSIKNSQLDFNNAGTKLTQVDGCSTLTRIGINDEGRDPDSKKRVFSEAKEIQKVAYYKAGATLNGLGKLVFTPIDQSGSGEYDLFDENLYYVSSNTPKIWNADTMTPILGTWENLGEYRTWNYSGTNPNRNKVLFTPANSSTVIGKNIILLFDFMVREGGGMQQAHGGFTYRIDNMLAGVDDTSGKLIDFNKYNKDSKNVPLVSPRTTGGFTDSAISRSISSFETDAFAATQGDLIYKGGAVELTYYTLNTGAQDTLPSPLYGRTVLSVYSILNKRTGVYQTPIIDKTITGFNISGITADSGDVIEYTLLLGDFTVDYVPHTRGVHNIASIYNIQISSNGTSTSYIINSKQLNNIDIDIDAVISAAGFYNGVSNRHCVYLNNRMNPTTITGIGTPLIKITFSSAPAAGTLLIPVLGYYNPKTTDAFTFKYEYTPYFGILKDKLSGTETQQVKVIYVDKDVCLTTAGTGNKNQYVPEEYKGLTSTLPINKSFIDYNLFGTSITTPITGGSSSLRRLSGKGVSSTSEAVGLKEGMTLTLKAGTDLKEMLRGVLIDSPVISERGIDLTTPLNHLTVWPALVRGLDDFNGELFLLIITTMSTIYNSTEGATYEYLKDKNLWKGDALGMGSETILNTGVTADDIALRYGNKILGSVDLFPLKYRPLVM